ncbi:MAG TPA: oligosaccharide flippase family protein [Bacteroidales bacterium]|nr:oligosaccharide flippase family protein [Bacteroidales bacterium]
MQKKFIINLFFLIGINLLVKPFWIFGIDRTVQNVVGAADYGLYFAVMNFSFLFGFMLDFGLTGFNNRSVAQHEHMAGKYTGSILGMKSALALLYALISFIAAFIIGYDTLHFKLLIWLGINQILSSFILFLRSNISGMQMFKTDSLLSVLDRLLMIVFFSVLLWGNVFDVSINIFYFASFQTLSYFITFLIALFIVLRKIKLSKIKWNHRLNIVLFRQSLPFAVLTFLMLFYYRVDSVMIERLLPQGSMHAGIYASAYRILDAFGMFSYLFSVILLPFFSRLMSKKQDVGPFLQLSAILLLSSAMMVSAVSLFNADLIMNWLYKEHVTESARVLQILMFTFIPVSSVYIFGTLLTAWGSMKKLNIIALCGVILNIGLNLVLIPQFLERGAAWSALITQSLVAISQIVLSFMLVKPSGLKRTVVLLTVFALAVYPVAWITDILKMRPGAGIIIIAAMWILFLLVNTLLLFRRNKLTISDLLTWRKD